jgi:hypothetical protein
MVAGGGCSACKRCSERVTRPKSRRLKGARRCHLVLSGSSRRYGRSKAAVADYRGRCRRPASNSGTETPGWLAMISSYVACGLLVT